MSHHGRIAQTEDCLRTWPVVAGPAYFQILSGGFDAIAVIAYLIKTKVFLPVVKEGVTV